MSLISLNWLPWITFFTDFYLIQLFLCYTLYLIFFSKNVFYLLFYFFSFIFYVGIFFCVYQLELFTGFLWLIESIIIFISLLLLFFLKTSGTVNNNVLIYSNLKYYVYGIILLVFIYKLISPSRCYINNLFNEIFYYSEYYEAHYNVNVNDFIAFLISYYYINNYFLLSLGVLILVSSLIVINLHRHNKNNRVQHFSTFFSIFNFWKQNIDFIFLRQQNLTDQEKTTATSRIFKKKIKI